MKTSLKNRLRILLNFFTIIPIQIIPATLLENRRQIEPNEIPSCLIPRLLVVFTRQLEILVTTLTLLLKRSEFWLELKRGDRARIQTKTAEFIALPFPLSSKLKIWSFHVVVVKGQQRNVQKSVITCRVIVLLIKPFTFFRFPLPS